MKIGIVGSMIYQERPNRFKPKFSVVSCYVEYEGKILLLHRLPHKSQGGKWGIPCGKIDIGENESQAMVREIREETGLSVHPGSLRYFKAIDVRHGDYDFVYHMYALQLAEGSEVKLSAGEHQACCWVSPSDALTMDLVDDLDECIRMFYGKERYGRLEEARDNFWSMKLERLLSFAKILGMLQAVERVIRVKGEERFENDVEHSYSLAMLAWYIIDTEKLSLDRGKVLRYALAHDLVEVYAGDTYLYTEDKELLASKPERERLAALRLAQELPEMPDIHEALRAYVARDDAESRFVYALDKMEPILKIYLDNGRRWREKSVTLSMIYEKKKDKVALSPEIKLYFDELMQLLEKHQAKLF